MASAAVLLHSHLRRSLAKTTAPATAARLASTAAPPPLASAAMAAPPPLPVLPTHAAGLAATHGRDAPALWWPPGSPGAPPALASAPLTFSGLASAAGRVAAAIRASLATAGPGPPPDPALPPCGPRIGVLARPGPAYAAGLWGAWAAGCVAVPLHAPYPAPALAHPVADAGCAALLVGGGCEPGVAGAAVVAELVSGGRGAAVPALDLDAALASLSSPPTPPSSDPLPAHAGAVLIYTSGTTGPPKGALHTAGGLAAQAASLAAAWRLGPGDVVLNALPLHHIHGLVNALVAPLGAGAGVELAPGFSPAAVWEALTRGLPGGGGDEEERKEDGPRPPCPPPPTVLMAVPTMYAYLLDAYDAMPPAAQARARAGAARLHLAVCGSAACPAPTADRWAALTGGAAPLLERYGMTEAGMVLGQALEGARVRGTVGGPMPGVGVRVVPSEKGEEDGSGSVASPLPLSTTTSTTTSPPSGELHVRWAGMFAGYWHRPDATAGAHTPDGWFRTGDVVAVEGGGGGGGEGGEHCGGGRDGPTPPTDHHQPLTFTILGRASTDILKVGGFKVSALQVEDALLAHGGVAEAAVVGLAGGARGDAVAAAVVLRRPGSGGGVSPADPPPTPAALSAWVAARLPPAAVPRAEDVVVVDALPRNAMGKVDKPALKRGVFAGRA
jgi:malonyl-CoA/methylmalonyl-CoA synthetase